MRGDIDLEKCVNEHYASLYRFALSLCRHDSDACDLVQETFYLLTIKGHQVNDPAKVKAWLFTSLFRNYNHQRRRLIRFPHRELDDVSEELPALPPAPPNGIDRETLFRAMKQLNEVFRAPVALFYLEDYSYPEIAQVLGIPLGTVKSRISRGITALQHSIIEHKKGRALVP